MGATFSIDKINGELDKKEVSWAFDTIMRPNTDYGWSRCPGVTALKRPMFDHYDDAEQWLLTNCEKDENALAVRLHEEGRQYWVVGAWCAT